MTNLQKLKEADVVAYHEAVAVKGNAIIFCSDDLDRIISFVKAGESFADACAAAAAPELKYVFDVLDKLEISRYIDFLSKTAITVPLPEKTLISNVIWVPWRIGEGNIYNMAHQVTVLSHELTHCLDSLEDIGWLLKYLSDPDERTDAEKKGFHTSMEVRFWLDDSYPDSDLHLGRIDAYYLPPTNIRVLRKALDDLAGPIEDGAVYTEAAKFCIDFFEKRWDRG